jgi:hypothetical protein
MSQVRPDGPGLGAVVDVDARRLAPVVEAAVDGQLGAGRVW